MTRNTEGPLLLPILRSSGNRVIDFFESGGPPVLGLRVNYFLVLVRKTLYGFE